MTGSGKGHNLRIAMLAPISWRTPPRHYGPWELVTSLDQFDQFRERGVGDDEETGRWMHAFSEILASPPMVELLRVEDAR